MYKETLVISSHMDINPYLLFDNLMTKKEQHTSGRLVAS